MHQCVCCVNFDHSSTLVLDGDIVIENLRLSGTLIVRAHPGARVTLRNLNVRIGGCVDRLLCG